MFFLFLELNTQNPTASPDSKFSSIYDACSLVNVADVSPSDSVAWILLKLGHKELRKTAAVSRRNEMQRCGGIGFGQLGVQKGDYIVKAILSFFSKAP